MTPSSQLARGARNPAMKTPPMAGVWMKYANMNCEMLPPCVAMTAIVLATVISRGTHSAFVWTAIQGMEARSGPTWMGRIDARKASPKPIRPAGTALSPLDALPELDPPTPVPADVVAPGATSVAGTVMAARWRRRASARSVLLARATVSPDDVGDGSGRVVERIVVQRPAGRDKRQ